MAQLLIKNFPEASSPEDYQLDDIIMVAEDSHQWGARELDPARFRVVSVPGTRADFEHTLASERGGMRDVYPRSMIEVRRLQPKMRDEARNAPIKQQRTYKHDGVNIVRKPLKEA